MTIPIEPHSDQELPPVSPPRNMVDLRRSRRRESLDVSYMRPFRSDSEPMMRLPPPWIIIDLRNPPVHFNQMQPLDFDGHYEIMIRRPEVLDVPEMHPVPPDPEPMLLLPPPGIMIDLRNPPMHLNHIQPDYVENQPMDFDGHYEMIIRRPDLLDVPEMNPVSPDPEPMQPLPHDDNQQDNFDETEA